MSTQREARNVYESIMKMLDKHNFNYKPDDDNLVINIKMHGDDLPMDFVLKVDAKRDLVIFSSMLPFKFNLDRVVAGAVAVCSINYLLADGSFDLDVRDGELSFKLTSSYKDSLLSEESLEYMFGIACGTVDKYNDKLLLISEGHMDPFSITD